MNAFRGFVADASRRLARRAVVVLGPAFLVHVLFFVWFAILMGGTPYRSGPHVYAYHYHPWRPFAGAGLFALGLAAVAWLLRVLLETVIYRRRTTPEERKILGDREAWALLTIAFGWGFVPLLVFLPGIDLPIGPGWRAAGMLLLGPGLWGWVASRGFGSLRSLRHWIAVVLLNLTSFFPGFFLFASARNFAIMHPYWP